MLRVVALLTHAVCSCTDLTTDPDPFYHYTTTTSSTHVPDAGVATYAAAATAEYSRQQHALALERYYSPFHPSLRSCTRCFIQQSLMKQMATGAVAGWMVNDNGCKDSSGS